MSQTSQGPNEPTTTSSSTTTSTEATETKATETKATMPGFSKPRPRATTGPDPLDPNSTTVSPPASSSGESAPFDVGDVGGFGDPSVASPAPATAGATSSRASIDREAIAFFAGIGITVFQFVGMLLHNRLSPGDDNAAWIPTDDEAGDVVAPLASIAARHAPVGDVVSGDVGDVIAAGVAAAGYGARSIGEAQQARRQREGSEGWSQQAEADHAASN